MKVDPLKIVRNRKRLEAAGRCQIEGDHDEAARIYRYLLESEPGHPGALHGLGVLFLRQGHLAEGEEALRLAIVGAPDVAAYWSDLGEACRLAGRPDEATVAYRRALELDPGFAEARNNLAVTLAALGDAEAAARELQAIIAFNPEHAAAHNNLGVLRERQGHTEEALQCYETAVRLQPDFADALENYSQLLKTRPDLMQGSLSRLTAHIDRAEAAEPE